MTINVGRNITPFEMDSAPVGTVVEHHFLGRRVKLVADDNVWASFEGGTTPLAVIGHYEIVYVPDDELIEPEPFDGLARQLWDVRNKVVGDFGFSVGEPSEQHKAVYRALADFVENRQPSQVLALDGHTWTLRENGLYSVEDPEGWSTLDEIEHYDGILSVIP